MAKSPGGGKSQAPPERTSRITSPSPSRLMYLFMVLVSVVILASGYVFYYFQEQHVRQRIESGLSILAQLKAEQISEWRAARLVDINTLAGSPSFTDTVAQYMASPSDITMRDKVLADLAIVGQSYPYHDVLLTDVNGDVLLSLNNSVSCLSNATLSQLAIAIEEHKAIFTDLYYFPDSNSPGLDVIAPLFPWEQDSPQAIGAVVFCIDPAQYLYPLLQYSPVPSETAEALLVERDGDQVLFLNELRHQKNTALKLRIPLSQQDVPAVMAVLGQEGVVEGKDYRGVEVLAALQHISDSPWYMVAKIDTSEALAGWRYQAGMIIAFFAGLLFAALAGIGFIWQRRQRLAYQALHQVELESQALRSHFDYLMKYANDIILLVNEKDHIVEVNERAIETYGYARQEMLGMPLATLMPPGQLQKLRARLRKIKREDAYLTETVHQRKDGSTFLAEVSGRTIKIEDKKYVQEIIRDITERKQAEKALRSSEELYRKFFKTTRDAVFITTKDGRWVDFNDGTVEILGYKDRDELQEAGVLAIWADQESRNRVGGKVEQQEFIRDEPANLRKKDNSLINVLVTAIARRDENGNLLGYQGTFKDITERKKAEEALRRSEERYRTILEEMQEGYYEIDLAGNWTFCNDAFCNSLGYSREELIGMNYRNVTLEDDVIPVSKVYEEAYRTGKAPNVFSVRAISKDGNIRLIEASVIPLISDEGDIIGFRGAEEALRRSEERYRTILEEMQEGYYEIDLAGNWTFCNDAFCNSLGYSREELIGMNYRNVTLEDDVIPVSKVYEEAYRTGKAPNVFSVRAISKDGNIRLIEASVIPLISDEGDIIGFRGVGRDVTEHRRAEEALRESEERYRTILNDMEESYYEADLKGNFTLVNDALCSLLGYSKEELIGMNYRVFTPPEDVERVSRASNQVYRTGEPVKLLLREMIRKDGSRIFTETSILALRNDKGEIIGWRGIGRDITERKRAEEELTRSRDLLNETGKIAKIGSWELDVETLQQNWTEGVYRIHEVELDYEPTVEKGISFYAPEAIPIISEAVQRAIDHGEPFDLELPLITAQRNRIWVHAIGRAHSHGGKIVKVKGTLQDVTERRQIENSLLASEEKYRILIENANEAIIVAQDGMLKFANSKAVELSGYPIEELKSIPFTDIIHPDDRDMVFDKYLKRLQGEAFPQIYPFRIVDREDNVKWAEINAVQIIWEGKPATLNFLTDITERKKTEQQALVNAKLASVGELVAGVAHEVNNPLTGIIGYAQLLADMQDVPKNVKDDLQKIYEESQRTVKIVQNLLRFARQYKPEKNLVDINDLLKRTLELEVYKLRTSNVALSTKLAADIPLILADYNQLQQVILNLVTNAQQAIAETKRKGKIEVSTAAVDDCAKISIADNGPGISEENMTRIFDPFFTTKPASSGSGLGLSVCHGIIIEHGGNIYAESTPGKGATFIIELPVATGEKAVIKEEKPVKKEKGQRRSRKVTGKILIVEDEPAIRAVLTRNLSAKGYQVQAVSNGKDALDKLANNVYDLLLFDLKMPGMSGSELYKAVKKKHPNSAKGVVFITGDAITADTRDFLVSTGRPYLIKPFDSKAIKDVIDKVLTGQNR